MCFYFVWLITRLPRIKKNFVVFVGLSRRPNNLFNIVVQDGYIDIKSRLIVGYTTQYGIFNRVYMIVLVRYFTINVFVEVQLHEPVL